MATRKFSKFQYGKESTRGTAVAATKMLFANVKGVPTDRKPVFIADANGVRAASNRTQVYEYLVNDSITIPDAYFQCLPMFLSCGLKGNITATETTGGQSDYLWTFLPSMTATNAPDSITLEMGDDVQAFEIEHVMFERLRIKGDIAQDGGASKVDIEGSYFGRQVTATTFTGAIAVPTVTTMNGKAARIYKDAAWANRGTTELTNSLRGFECEIMTGLHVKFFGDANLYFATFGEGQISGMLTLTLEGDSTADTLFDEFQAGTAKAYSLKINGPQIGSGSTYNFTFNLWGKPESVVPLSAESNGNNLHAVVIHGMYDTTGAAILECKVTTNSNTL